MMVVAAGVAVGLVVGLVMACGDAGNGQRATVIFDPTATPSGPVVSGTGTETPGGPTSTPGGLPTPPDQVTGQQQTCGDILAPIDKQNWLAEDCEPPNLVPLPNSRSYGAGPDGNGHWMREDASVPLLRMLDEAEAEGVVLFVSSAYRSYAEQVATYQYWVSTLGQEEADRVSARPGHSEHQLGTTADVVSASAGYRLDAFAGTPEAAWVAENSWKYGFIVSYPEGKEAITGYAYEPWHVRYVGVAVAAEVHASGLTLGEYLLER